MNAVAFDMARYMGSFAFVNANRFYKLPVAVKYPKNVTATQIDTISANLAVLEQAIANSDYDSVQKLMDISSFMDFLFLQELTHNVELEAPRSMYLYKDSSGLYHMGPVWDFDGGFAPGVG